MRTIFVILLTLAAMSFGPPAAQAVTRVEVCNFPATTDVRLVLDLTCSGLDGIVVQHNGITIDLGGHTLTGNLTTHKYGVNDNGFDNVTIIHGTIRSFDQGIYAYGTADHIPVQNVVTSENAFGGVVLTGLAPSVRAVRSFANGGGGMNLIGNGAVVVASQAIGNLEIGINIVGMHALVKNSEGSGNDVDGSVNGDGIRITGDFAHVLASRTSGNESNGIEVAGESAVLKYNVADGNGYKNTLAAQSGDGISVTGFFTTAPIGHNIAAGNHTFDCAPSNLC
jgi:hypothetical protein